MRRLVLDLSPNDIGIDLSRWIEEQNLWGVIIKRGGNQKRIGGRYYNASFDGFYNEAKRLGLKVGAYYYSDIKDADEAVKDANHCLSLLDGYELDLPVYIDIEDKDQLTISNKKLTAIVMNWCEAIESRGYRGGVYSSSEFFYRMDDCVCQHSLWLAYWAHNPPSWCRKDRGYDLWQQGAMSLDGTIEFKDVTGYHDADWWFDEEVEPMSIKDKILKRARGELGVRYWSMHEGPRGSGEEGWGCAMFYAWCLNKELGTNYYGSCYNFAGDALGQAVDQGGGEFEWISEAEARPGDAVLYSPAGYTGTDYDDYGHIAMYVGQGYVIGAMGRGTPGSSNYLNIGISETPIETQSLGGKYRFVRSIRVRELEKKEQGKVVPAKVYGYNAKLYQSNNTDAQKFVIEYAGDGYIKFKNVLTKMFLDVKDGSNKDHTPVRVWEPNGSIAQQWKLISCSGDYQGLYELEPKCAPGMRLDCVDGGTENKTGLQIHPDNDTAAQRWYLIDSQDGKYRLASSKSGLCIDCGSGVQ